MKVATHERQTFYNVVHHAILDRDGGRVIRAFVAKQRLRGRSACGACFRLPLSR